MSIGVRQLAHVCVLTDDVDAALAFYTGPMGLKKAFDFTRGGKFYGFYLDAGARTYIEVFHNDEAPFSKTGQVNHLCLEVADLKIAVSRLRAAGIEVTEPKFGVDDTWQAWLKDPSGTPIELFEYTHKSAQFVGGDRAADW